MKRTGSMSSRVGPADEHAPALEVLSPRSRRRRERDLLRIGEAPLPRVAVGEPPASGPTTCIPRARSTATLSCTAGFCHMRVFIAGATSTGQVIARSVVVTPSSPIPARIRAMRSAVAGATMARSHRAEQPGGRRRGRPRDQGDRRGRAPENRLEGERADEAGRRRRHGHADGTPPSRRGGRSRRPCMRRCRRRTASTTVRFPGSPCGPLPWKRFAARPHWCRPARAWTTSTSTVGAGSCASTRPPERSVEVEHAWRVSRHQ